jgi:competence protein ComEC
VVDQRWSSWIRGTPYGAKLKSPLQVERRGLFFPTLLLRPLFQYLAWFEGHCRVSLSPEAHRLVLSVFLGQKSSLEEDERQLIRDLGVFHLFVVSGFHIALIVAFLHWVLRPVKWPGKLIVVALMWSYIVGIGSPLAACRAGLIMSLVYLMNGMGVKSTFLNSLGVSAILLLFFSPRILYSAGFQFSYGCLLAIGILVLPMGSWVNQICRGIQEVGSESILISRRRRSRLRRRSRFTFEVNLGFRRPKYLRPFLRITCFGVGYLTKLLICGISIQLFILPILLFYSNRVGWLYWLDNLLLVPVFTVFVPICFIYFVTAWLPFEPVVSALVDFCGSTTVWIMESLANFSWSTFFPHPNGPETCLYYAVILGILLLQPLRLKCFAVLAPALFLFWLNLPERSPARLMITLLDTGQSECIHIRYPDGNDALVDTGGLAYSRSPDFIGERIVSRYLWQIRSQGLRYVLITHADTDHKQGYQFVSRAFPIRLLFFSELQPEYREPMMKLNSNDSFTFSGVVHKVHHPGLAGENHRSSNESSIVFTLRYQDFSMLFTGDINQNIEASILPDLRESTILKVPHHGSATSTSVGLLSAVSPRLAMISAGRNNNFGHPARAVLERLASAGIPTFCTSEFGSLRIVTDGNEWRIQHFSSEEDSFVKLTDKGSVLAPTIPGSAG